MICNNLLYAQYNQTIFGYSDLFKLAKDKYKKRILIFLQICTCGYYLYAAQVSITLPLRCNTVTPLLKASSLNSSLIWNVAKPK